MHPTGAGNNHIPTAGAAGQFLKYSASGTAVWAADNNTTYGVGDSGLTEKNFTTALKNKLDGITAGANVNTWRGIDDTPVNGQTAESISSNWAYDHNAATSIHGSTSANTANRIVMRDASGNFSANIMTGTATKARFADVAEKYLSDQDYKPGTVLIFGGEKEVTISTTQADRRVAGIVSTNPAYLMNAELKGGVEVALLGKVPCKVVGLVKKGDLMVSSSTPGCAEALSLDTTPIMGTIIGKALENKNTLIQETIEIVTGRV